MTRRFRVHLYYAIGHLLSKLPGPLARFWYPTYNNLMGKSADLDTEQRIWKPYDPPAEDRIEDYS